MRFQCTSLKVIFLKIFSLVVGLLLSFSVASSTKVYLPEIAGVIQADKNGLFDRIWGELLAEHSLDVKLIRLPFARALSVFENDHESCLGVGNAELARLYLGMQAEEANTSYYENSFAIFSLKTKPLYRSLEELDGRNIGHLIGDKPPYNDALASSQAIFIPLKTHYQTIAMLKAGRLDAAIAATSDMLQFSGIVQHTANSTLFRNKETLVCHTSSKNSALIKQFEAALEHAKAEGKIADIIKFYETELAKNTVEIAILGSSFWSALTEEDLPAEGSISKTVRDVFAMVNVKLTRKEIPWPHILSAVEMGTIDGGYPFAKTPDRQEKFLFSEPIGNATRHIYHRSDRDFYWERADDLKGLRIGVVRGADFGQVHLDLIEHIESDSTFATIVEVKDDIQNMRLLSTGRIDVFFGEDNQTEYLKQKLAEVDPEFDSSFFEPATKPLMQGRSLHVVFNRTERGKLLAHLFHEGWQKYNRISATENQF